ncbi:2',3'-cyclic-nucleotide 2'-phosphodiesterase [Cohnella sp. CIP 111063]|uniref:bifunctional 2',3'-cyclic-nucleotide 2'-phosphodiesterase/3'-nucleotidase n=1 Tax=unclassified Cohnella TaxID=2636738 RepID=UPI000B8BE449|nr:MULTISPECIES: bifunctional 2',3'-cyclic-nucleotide 2'-phosphodiesterase/3'-nucleotidase [unclassified Cohnella]OXS53473.1 2',3'-cyclic-nucleotide 2'-phosphodiesterase [Cohnella sp. CIP 111063]PRX61488.1 2',3'-cyclic-nucleotide 2'-phosphodiesterase/3'-nucleotidase [Cohnella sp. SGD-V74]
MLLKKIAGAAVAASLLLGSPIGIGKTHAEESEHKLEIMATTEIHAHLMPYDYFRDAPDEQLGLAKTYTLVKQVREHNPNTLLFNTGDNLQGAIIGEHAAILRPLAEDEPNPIIAAMNEMNYDAVNIGNHEFDFGLDFMHRSFEDANFPIINANLYHADESGKPGENYFTPYVMLDRVIDGIPIKIGVLGVAPPGITIWHADKLAGKIVGEPVLDTVEKYLPKIKAEGADLIIVNLHGGKRLEDGKNATINDRGEHSLYFLAEKYKDDIDAIVFGHEQSIFPGDEDYDEVEGLDNKNGLIHGIPSVMGGFAGDHLGVIELKLVHNEGKWQVTGGSSRNVPVEETTEAAPEIVEAVKARHEQTIDYVRNSIGVSEVPLNHFFSRVQDSRATQLINLAQVWKGEQILSRTEYKDLPILSLAPPFRAGRSGPSEYTNIAPGPVSVSAIADLYMYANTLYIVKLNGRQVIDVLEQSAENFNQIDPSLTEEQELLSAEPPYNFDQVYGLRYQIDVTKPVGQRIIDPTYEGQPVTEQMEFAVVTNNHRASGGGNFPHMDGTNTIYASDDANRDALIEYVTEIGTIAAGEPGWQIVPVNTAGPVVFKSSPSGREAIQNAGLTNVSYVEERDGWGIYRYHFEDLLAQASAGSAQETEEAAASEPAEQAGAQAQADESHKTKSDTLLYALIGGGAVVAAAVAYLLFRRRANRKRQSLL